MKKYTPHLAVFLSSIGVMVIELVAGRLVSKYFGTSLFTWTGVIGVVLGGISLGNFLGGRLADKYTPVKAAGPVMLISSGIVFLILVLDIVLDGLFSGAGSIVTSAMIGRSVLFIFILFFLPSAGLGTLSPIMAKYALDLRGTLGRTVGNIYAIGAVGSIIGTFLAGYVLVPLLNLKIIVLIVSLVIAALSLLFLRRKLISVAVLAGIVVLFFLLGIFDPALKTRESDGVVLYQDYSSYSYIKVKDIFGDSDGGKKIRERVLIMDGLIHNRHDLQDADNLLYEYEQMFAAATDFLVQSRGARFLTLGGGAMTFPMFLHKYYSPSENTVVEIDPQVVEVAKKYFYVPSSEGPSIVCADARAYVNYVTGKKTYDVVYIDAFNSFSVPYHLTTKEFTKRVHDILAPGGSLVVNCIDVLTSGKFLNAYAATLKSVFKYVRVYGDSSFSPEYRSTFVILAGNAEDFPDELQTITSSGNRTAGQALNDKTLADLRVKNGQVVLSDYFAPVENYMAPVFLSAVD